MSRICICALFSDSSLFFLFFLVYMLPHNEVLGFGVQFLEKSGHLHDSARLGCVYIKVHLESS